MKKAKLLLVEDDPSLSFVIKDNLERQGYEVVHAANGQQAGELFGRQRFDLCLLDVMLPKVDGFTLASTIRASNDKVPILFITARSLQEDKLKGFGLGADDYITKPFSMEELLYRIAVFLKRSGQAAEEATPSIRVRMGRYVLDTDCLTLSCHGEHIKLTRRESDLLFLLSERKNLVVKREEILVKLWGDDDYFAGRSLDVFISRLRKYLKDDADIRIENHHSVGFRLVVK